jgi:hypothetical protein
MSGIGLVNGTNGLLLKSKRERRSLTASFAHTIEWHVLEKNCKRRLIRANYAYMLE